MLGLKKILGPKKCRVPKKSGSKEVSVQRNVGPKKCFSKNNFSSKKFEFKTIQSPTKIWSPKIILAQKHFLSKEKILIVKKNFGHKNL